MSQVFIGSEAVATGNVSKYDLRARYRRVLPDVYIAKDAPLSLHERTVATWLWSRRQGIICGLAASALHGAKWVDDNAVIDVNWPGRKPPPGVRVRNETLLDGEITCRAGIPVTTIARTAFDLARRGAPGRAVERLDALACATNFAVDDVLEVARAHPHVKGLSRVPGLLQQADSGAQSPRETWLRRLLIDAGFPRPQTQIPVLRPDGYSRYFLDMGWPEVMVAVEYDGEHHRLDRNTYRDDLVRSEYLAHIGWRRIRVVAGHRRPDIVRRVHQVWP